MSVTKKTYSVGKIKQLIDLNGESTNFDAQFRIVSKNNEPFDILVVDQTTLDNNPNLEYKKADKGEISGKILHDKNVFQNYFIILKADQPCECEVEIIKKELPKTPVIPVQKSTIQNKSNNTFSWVNIFIVIGIIAIIGVIYMYYQKSKKSSPIEPIQSPIYPKESFKIGDLDLSRENSSRGNSPRGNSPRASSVRDIMSPRAGLGEQLAYPTEAGGGGGGGKSPPNPILERLNSLKIQNLNLK